MIPEYCMKTKNNFVLIVIIASYSKIRSNTKYLTGKKDESLRLAQDSGDTINGSNSFLKILKNRFIKDF